MGTASFFFFAYTLWQMRKKKKIQRTAGQMVIEYVIPAPKKTQRKCNLEQIALPNSVMQISLKHRGDLANNFVFKSYFCTH